MPNPDDLLSRAQVASALTAAGYPTAPTTLAMRASRGNGPPFVLYSGRALYRWSSVLEWAQSRALPPRAGAALMDAISRM